MTTQFGIMYFDVEESHTAVQFSPSSEIPLKTVAEFMVTWLEVGLNRQKTQHHDDKNLDEKEKLLTKVQEKIFPQGI